MEDLKKDFSSTLLMPNTEFPMRGNLGVNELPIQEKWEKIDLYKPDVVYHAAAHKHVPLMEDSPNEAIKNNVFGK